MGAHRGQNDGGGDCSRLHLLPHTQRYLSLPHDTGGLVTAMPHVLGSMVVGGVMPVGGRSS